MKYKYLRIFQISFILISVLFGGLAARVFLTKTDTFVSLPFQKIPTLCKDCNIILVSLDTVSANHLPCYGYERDTAKNLCAFGKENILFTNAFSNASWTLPSHVSLFTGLYPFTHGVNTHQDTLQSTTPFLPSILKDVGYTTIFVYPPSMTFSTEKVYNRGIDEYYDEDASVSWHPQLTELQKNVAENKKTFLFLHTYAAHPPFLIEDPLLYPTKIIDEIPLTNEDLQEITDDTVAFLKENISSFIGSDDFTVEESNQLKEFKRFVDQHPSTEVLKQYTKNFLYIYPDLSYRLIEAANYVSIIDKNNPEHIDYIRALYDQKIHELDNENIKGLIDFYSSNPEIQENTILIFTADHGEEFMQHKQISHITNYDTNLHVPLIMAIPHIKKRTVTSLVQSIDITPTILDLIGVPLPTPVQGISLVGGILGKRIPNRMLIEDEYLLATKTIRYDKWKLFVQPKDDTFVPFELYDYKSDPKETTNLLSSNFDIAKKILQMYKDYAKKWEN